MADWQLITNHGSVLFVIYGNAGISTLEIASKLGIDENTVSQVLSDLEEGGYIERVYRLVHAKPPRHESLERIQKVPSILSKELQIQAHAFPTG